MTTTILYADTTDGYILSKASSKSGAVNGTGTLSADTGSTFAQIGLDYDSGDGPYQASEAFLHFDNTAPSGETITGASLRVKARNQTGYEYDWRVAEYDWGAAVDTGDWRTAAQLAALDPIVDSDIGQQYITGKYVFIGQPELRALCATTGDLRLIVYTQGQTSTSPSFGENATIGFYTTESESGTTYDPALIYTSAPTSTLLGCLGAQVQLSDGTWAGIEGDGAGGYTLVHIDDEGSTATIATIPIGTSSSTFGAPFAAQGLALACDDDDNLYVVGRSGSGPNIIAGKAYWYSGSSWTAKTLLSASLPYTGDDAYVSQVAAAWNWNGTWGTVFTVVGYESGDPGEDYGMAYALLNVYSLLNGSGSLLRGSGSATDRSIGDDRSPDSYCPDLGVGTNLDVAVPDDDYDRGYVVAGKSGTSSGYNVGIGYTSACTRTRYILSSGGSSISQSVSDTADLASATDDAATKVRAIPINDTRFVIVSASATYGLVVEDAQNNGWNNTITTVGATSLDGEIDSMPSAATLAVSAAWDAVYDPTSNQIWVYYFDKDDGRNLLRTSVDLSTRLAVQDEVVVDATVGDAGSTNQAIRCTRGQRSGSIVMITVANKTSGGTLSTIYVPNGPNTTPTTPTLTARDHFDATSSALFEWTFNDPDPGDTQSAYQLTITEVGAGSPTYDSTKTIDSTESMTLPGGTLTNGKDWTWNVTCWDAADAQSPTSADGTFSTSATGTTTITDPPADNPAGLIVDYYDIVWSVAGTTQDDYRVQLTRTDTSAQISDTGWVNGADVTYQVTGLISDVACRVDVTVRDSLDIETNTAARLLTASFNAPDTPTITATTGTLASDDDGPHITVTVANPTPTGSRPDVTTNRIYRRVYTTGTAASWTLVGSAIPDGTYDDYTAAGGTVYEYYAVAVGTTGGTADSSTDTASLTLTGLWLHDAQAPATTSRNYRYTGGATSSSLEATAVGSHYAGRSYPVFDFGESENASVALQVAVPFGEDWADDLARLQDLVTIRRSIVARDGRGRSMTGAPSGYTQSDEPWGTTVSLTVTETDTGE